MKLYDTGVYLQNGQEIIPENQANLPVAKEEAARNTIAYSILKAHNKSDNMEKLQIKFDKLTSHDITFVGIIQTARASGLEKFPVPYVLTNCHNSLCAVGGTINEDDHMFGLTCAKKYGGVYVPPHQAVIHQFAREMLAGGGKMILGSDSHTRYGALGTMAMGEGGPELVKQLLCQTYDINMPGVVAIYLNGTPRPGRRTAGRCTGHHWRSFCQWLCEEQSYGVCRTGRCQPKRRFPYRSGCYDNRDHLPFFHLAEQTRRSRSSMRSTEEPEDYKELKSG